MKCVIAPRVLNPPRKYGLCDPMFGARVMEHGEVRAEFYGVIGAVYG